MSDVFVAPGAQTPDDQAVSAPADRHLKADIVGALKAKIVRKTITLAVPDRPGYSVDYDPRLDADLMRLWGQQASGNGKHELDTFELGLYVLAGQCRGIRVDGELIRINQAGEPVTSSDPSLEVLTFDSPLFREMYQALDITVVVREFYGADMAVGSTFARLQQEAEAGSLDPTTASSGS